MSPIKYRCVTIQIPRKTSSSFEEDESLGLGRPQSSGVPLWVAAAVSMCFLTTASHVGSVSLTIAK
jgi:hypothetical protein